MVVKRSAAKDSSEDSVLLLPRKKSGNMLGNENDKDKVKISQKVAYGLGHILNDICCAMWFSYLLFFFEVILKMPSGIAGMVICAGQIADAVASPIIGILVDRYGTRKSWHLLGTTLIAFTYALLFSNCPWIPETKSNLFNKTETVLNTWENLDEVNVIIGAIYFIFLVLVFQAGWAMVQIAHLAIIPDMTLDKNERANLSAIRYTANYCAFVFVFLITWFILHITEGTKSSLGPEDAYKFKGIVLLGLLVGGVCTLLFHAILEIPRGSTASTRNHSTKSLRIWFDVVGEYFKSLLLYQVTMVYFASRMFISISLVYMPLYLTEQAGKEAEYIASVPLISYIGSLLASLIVRQMGPMCSTKASYIVGTVLGTAACVWIKIGFTYTAELFGIAAILGAGSSITGVASLCLCADLIGTDTENGAFVYSVVTTADKLLGGVVIIVIEYFKTGIFSGSSTYYQDVLSFGCGTFCVFGFTVLLTMYCNSNKSVQSKTVEGNSQFVKN